MRPAAGTGKIAIVVAVALFVAGCAADQPPADAVASYRGGSLSIGDLEEVLRRDDQGLAAGSHLAQLGIDELIERYRQAARQIVVERILTAEHEVPAMLAELGDQGAALRRQVNLALYLGPRLGNLEVGPAEVERYYQENRDKFRRGAARQLWHLFRRHRDPARPQETTDFLLELKKKAESGAGFSQLAQEFSDSETRVLGGRLGLVRSGRLPKKLEEKVFALAAGAVSEPIPLPGGAGLFYVSEAIDAVDFSLEDARPAIVAHLVEERRRARIAELLGERRPPPEAKVLELRQLAEALGGQDQDQVVLEIGDFRLTAAELKKRLEAEREAEAFVLVDAVERLDQRYQDLVNEQLLVLAAAEEKPLPARDKARDHRLRLLATEALVEQKLESLIAARVAGDVAALRRFYQDNVHLYQSELRLELKTLTLPMGPDAPQDLAQLEALRAELASGRIDLAAAAKKISGEVGDLGWVGFETLMTYEPKVRYYLLDLNGPGYTVPFQINRRLGLFQVVAREEPRVLPFEEVQERLQGDFIGRHRQALHRATVDALLEEAGFQFDADRLRRSLTPPAPDAAGKSG